MKNYNKLLHEDLNEDGDTRHEELGTVSAMLNDLEMRGLFYESLKEEGYTDVQVFEEGIAILNEELNRLYQELK